MEAQIINFNFSFKYHYLSSTLFNDKISHRMKMTVGDISSSENILLFTEGHGNHFKTAFNLFKDKKFLDMVQICFEKMFRKQIFC